MAFDWGGFAGGFARGLEPGYRLGKAISEDLRAADFAKQVKDINERYDNEATLANTDYATVDALNKGKDVQQAVNIARNGEVPILQEGIRQIGMENPETGKIELTQNRTVDPALAERLAATNRHPGLTDNTPVAIEHNTLADTLRAIEDGREAAFLKAQMQYHARNPEKMAELMQQQRVNAFKRNLFGDFYKMMNGDQDAIMKLADISTTLGILPTGTKLVPNDDGTFNLVYTSGDRAGQVVDDGERVYEHVRPTEEQLKYAFAEYAKAQKAYFDKNPDAISDIYKNRRAEAREDRKLDLEERKVRTGEYTAESNNAYRQGLLTGRAKSGYKIPSDWVLEADPKDMSDNPRQLFLDKHKRVVARYDEKTGMPKPLKDLTPEQERIKSEGLAKGMIPSIANDGNGFPQYTLVDPEDGSYMFINQPGVWHEGEGKASSANPFPSMAGSSTQSSGGKYSKWWKGGSKKPTQAVSAETFKEPAGTTEEAKSTPANEAKPAPAKDEPPTKSAGKSPQTSGTKQRSIYDEIDKTKGSGWDSQKYPDVYAYLDATEGNSPASAIPTPPSKEPERFVNHKGYSTRVAQGDLRPTTAQRLWDKSEQANQERFGDISRMNDRELTTINAARAKAGQPPKYREEFKESRADDLARLKNVAKAELSSRKKEAIPTRVPATKSGKAMPSAKPSLPTKGRILSRPNDQAVDGRGVPIKGWKNREYRIEAKKGEKIPSVRGGKVVFADWVRGLRGTVIVEHEDGNIEVFTGVNSPKKQGDTVKPGESLGTVEGGDYGYSVRRAKDASVVG